MSQLAELPFQTVTDIARKAWGTTDDIVISPMIGGASTRKFARVKVASGATAVAMYVPEAHGSDEIVKDAGRPSRWPFLEIRDLLAERGVLVPSVLFEDCAEGLLLVEDLGDQTLAVALEAYPHQRTMLYQTAVADLVRAQQALADLPGDSIVRTRSFDRDLLTWEVEHFRQWALEARDIHLSSSQNEVFEQAARFLANTIAESVPCFVHRDYQSRNIMVKFASDGQAKLYWIDFQDALLGPRTYDLVALLGDSYQVFERSFVDARLAEFAQLHDLGTFAQDQLRYEFDLVTVQRKLKDAGRFIFVDRVKQNPSFLDFVEPTIDKVFVALERLDAEPVLQRLSEMLHQVLRPTRHRT